MTQPKSVCLVALMVLASVSAIGVDSLWYWERFNEIPYGQSDDGYIDSLDYKGRTRLAGSFDWIGPTDISTFDEYTIFSIWLSAGEPFGIDVIGFLGDDPSYKPGKCSVVIPLYHFEEISWDEERVVPDGQLWLKWDEKGFRFIAYGRIHDYSDLGYGVGIGFRGEEVGTFTNLPNVGISFWQTGSEDFDVTKPFPIVGKVSRRDATYKDPESGDVYDYTITSVVLGGPMILEPEEEQPRWLRRRIRIPHVRP
jgi:hypothetical protein